MKSVGYIARPRLKRLPEPVRLQHELCFFLHDECARAFVEYETAEAHLETIRFKNAEEFEMFEEIARDIDVIEALRKCGYDDISKKVILNTISVAMISDYLHHIYEALRCLEKRKFIVGINLLRKPLKENLLYLAWMLGKCEDFYEKFTKGDPTLITQSAIGQQRKAIYSEAMDKIGYGQFVDSEIIESTIYNRRVDGLELLFQHAVHLVTQKYPELRTASQNFNFIFKSPADDDVYEAVYHHLPSLMLFASHLIMAVLDQTREMDKMSRDLFHVRSVLAFNLIIGSEQSHTLLELSNMVPDSTLCSKCCRNCNITLYNALSMLLRSDFRCSYCHTRNHFLLFSYPEILEV